MTETVVRLAGLDDEVGLLNLCRLMHAEQGSHPLNWPKVIAMMRRATMRQVALAGVIGPSDDIKAGILILLDPVWYSDECQLLEVFNFVREDSRRSDYAKRMIEFAKKCADELDVDLTIGVLSNIRTEAKVKLYARQVPEAGRFFIYSPKAKSIASATA